MALLTKPIHYAGLAAAVIGAAVIGVTVANPACACTTKERAYLAAMKTDLRGLAASRLAGTTFTPSTSVTIQVSEGDSGWAAVASHSASQYRCEIFVGIAPRPLGVATAAGEPKCAR